MDSILHLKSGIAYLENRDLVVMEELAGRQEFAGYNLIPVPAEETYACNCVLVNERGVGAGRISDASPLSWNVAATKRYRWRCPNTARWTAD